MNQFGINDDEVVDKRNNLVKQLGLRVFFDDLTTVVPPHLKSKWMRDWDMARDAKVGSYSNVDLGLFPKSVPEPKSILKPIDYVIPKNPNYRQEFPEDVSDDDDDDYDYYIDE